MKITSIKDPIIEEARSLQTASGRQQHGKTLLYGLEQILWAQKAGINIEHIFVEQGSDRSNVEGVGDSNVIEVSAGILKKISGTDYLIFCIAVAKFNQTKRSITAPFVVVLDGLQDFGNIGSIIRTGNGFSIHQFMFVNMQTDPFQRKVIDASRGQVFESHIVQKKDVRDAITYLKNHDYQIVVTSPHAKHLQAQVPLLTKKVALVVGNETLGISDELMAAADVTIQIPMSANVESLNVSVAAGISMYELKFKQALMMLKEKIMTDFGRLVGVTSKLIRMAFDKEIRQYTNLSGMQVIFLMIMQCDDTMTKDQIVKDVALFGDELDQFLALLYERGYITAINNTYTLTSEGRRFIAEIFPLVDKTHQNIMALLNHREIEQLKQLLSKVQQGCMNILDEKS